MVLGQPYRQADGCIFREGQHRIRAMRDGRRLILLWWMLWMAMESGLGLLGQIDPMPRQVFQAAYAYPLHEHAPMAAYGFYYYNQPGFIRTNLTLRVAAVPVFLDTELGITDALGPDTDLGINLAGGGFADGYAEIREGNYLPEESFLGHTAEGNLSLYHLFNPDQLMPLNGILRAGMHGSFYQRDGDTADDFSLPRNRPTGHVRAGLRLGGREPYLTPHLAGEVSLWYENQYRWENAPYGFEGDRSVEESSHLFWLRTLLAYTWDTSGRFLEVSLTAGTTLEADRFSTYRLGGSLPFVSEFPLPIPGYHNQEISADQFILLNSALLLPLGASRSWSLFFFGSAAVVDYLPGLAQDGNFHAGLGGGVFYRSRNRAWQIGTAYGYGFEAIRNGDWGGQTVTFLLQYDLDALASAGGKPFWNPLVNASTWRGIFRRIGGK
ncbi:MAG TPA: hypothetical protein P5186_02820 [Candidatus Paceibacterota bacterium]|nr:hypothetical protein [Candidatus Paceibacterota bacterium]